MANVKAVPETVKETKVEDWKSYEVHMRNIKSGLSNMKKNYIKVAYALYEIKKDRLFTCDNYRNIYDFAKEKFGLSRGVCSEYINVAEKFCLKGTEQTGELEPEYKDYGISQLAVLQSMDKECQKLATPQMTVTELKNLKADFNRKQEQAKEEQTEEEPLEISNEITYCSICHAVDIEELFSNSCKKKLKKYWKDIYIKYSHRKPRLVVQVEFYDKEV